MNIINIEISYANKKNSTQLKNSHYFYILFLIYSESEKYPKVSVQFVIVKRKK